MSLNRISHSAQIFWPTCCSTLPCCLTQWRAKKKFNWLFILVLDFSQLNFFFARHCVRQHGSVEQHVGQNICAECEIWLSDIEIHYQTVVTTFGCDLAAHCFQVIRDLLCCSRFSSLQKRLGDEPGNSAGCLG